MITRYVNPMMPQRGGWWPDCLGVIAIVCVIGIATIVTVIGVS